MIVKWIFCLIAFRLFSLMYNSHELGQVIKNIRASKMRTGCVLFRVCFRLVIISIENVMWGLIEPLVWFVWNINEVRQSMFLINIPQTAFTVASRVVNTVQKSVLLHLKQSCRGYHQSAKHWAHVKERIMRWTSKTLSFRIFDTFGVAWKQRSIFRLGSITS